MDPVFMPTLNTATLNGAARLRQAIDNALGAEAIAALCWMSWDAWIDKYIAKSSDIQAAVAILHDSRVGLQINLRAHAVNGMAHLAGDALWMTTLATLKRSAVRKIYTGMASLAARTAAAAGVTSTANWVPIVGTVAWLALTAFAGYRLYLDLTALRITLVDGICDALVG